MWNHMIFWMCSHNSDWASKKGPSGHKIHHIMKWYISWVLCSYDPNIHLSISDLATDSAHSPSVISLKIKHSKTDQGRRGVTVVISKTGDDICPVSALLSYLVSKGTKPGALFLWTDRSLLSKSQICWRSKISCHQGWSSCKRLCRTQLLHRSGNHGRNSRNTGLYNSEPRQMEKLILPALHQNSTSSSSRGITKTVKMLYLTTSGGYQIQ